MYITLARLMNDNTLYNLPLINSITLKYLESGHTFLSCDSFHGVVEKNMRQVKNIYNFDDFVTTVQTSGGGPKVIQMEAGDFTAWDRRVTTGKAVAVPLLSDIQVTKFQRNSKLLYFKLSHEDEEFTECDFLMRKTQKDIDNGQAVPEQQEEPRGIPAWKKNGIVRQLCGIMPENKRRFWESLPTSDVIDLTHHDGDRPEMEN